jgi:deoxyribodipyrimidine photo-lyase
MQKLIDSDFASNNGGWQWCASTGADAAPYFRIFNTYLQSERVQFLCVSLMAVVDFSS